MNSLGRNRKREENNIFESPCTLKEAVQISRGVAEDVLKDYQNQTGHLQVAISMQLEILKRVVIGAGLITEELFKKEYMEKVAEFNKMQEDRLKDLTEDLVDSDDSKDSPKMTAEVSDIEVQKLS